MTAAAPADRRPDLSGADDIRRRSAGTTAAVLSLACVAAAMALWVLSLPMIDPDAMDDLGLVSVLPWPYFAALGLLQVGFVLALVAAPHRWIVPAIAVAGLILLLHATPAIVYGTLRYSWAWKHIGIIDYIMRHGTVDPVATFLPAYHNWPGFFVAFAWIAEAARFGPLEIAAAARFFPVLTNAIFAALLVGIYSRLTSDRRLVWAAVWIFLGGNWVGQDYFSPQAVAFALYLLVIFLCIGPLMPEARAAKGGLLARIAGIRRLVVRSMPRRLAIGPFARLAAVVLVTLAILAIAATHQLTPLILVFALSALVVVTPLSLAYPAIAGFALVFWVLFPAAPFSSLYLPEELASFGRSLDEVTDKFVDTAAVDRAVATVVWVGRGLTGAVGLLAFLGWVRRIANGGRDGIATVLAAAPLPVLVTTSYGGEALFRVYFFCLPFLAFFAASLFFATPAAMRRIVSNVLFALVTSAIVGGFLFANNGKDRQYRFTADEVAAAAWLYEHGKPDSLLVEGARNYPSQFMNYENFAYLPLSNESPEAKAAFMADPVGTLRRWLSDPRWSSGYVVITRSQKAYAQALGELPDGALDDIAASLLEASDFRLVFANRDAMIFTQEPSPTPDPAPSLREHDLRGSFAG